VDLCYRGPFRTSVLILNRPKGLEEDSPFIPQHPAALLQAGSIPNLTSLSDYAPCIRVGIPLRVLSL
jgi:hypothetical protein